MGDKKDLLDFEEKKKEFLRRIIENIKFIQFNDENLHILGFSKWRGSERSSGKADYDSGHYTGYINTTTKINITTPIPN